MTTPTAPRTSVRPALLGLAVGFAMTFLVAILALLFPLFERLEDVLVPARIVLSPWSEAMADWNGLGVMLLAGAVNGLVYAAAFAVVGLAAAAAGGRS